MHISCTNTNTNTLNGLTMRFHMTQLTLEFHRVRLKWFPSPWYIRYKSCTYLASRLVVSPNGSNRASTWAYHLGELSVVFKTTSNPMVRLAQQFTNLAPILTLSLNRLKWDSTWPTSPRCSIRCVQNIFKPMVHWAQAVHLSCSDTKTISKRTKIRFHMTHVT
jgi:hypothetical protein